MLIYAIIFIVTTLLFFVKNRDCLFINPTVLFCFFQLIMFLGSLRYLDLTLNVDYIHVITMLWAQIAVILGATLVDLTKKRRKMLIRKFKDSELLIDYGNKTKALVINSIIVVSIIVSSIYYFAIGYNVFLISLRSFFLEFTIPKNIADLRLATYAGERYFAPGYVNQFKNILFPLMLMYLAIFYINAPNRINKYLLLLYFVLNAIFIFGTGQRGAFVIACLVFFVLVNLSLNKKKRMKMIVLLTIFALFLFILSSLFLGRQIKDISEINFVSLFSLITSRVFGSNQLSSVVGFRYIYELKISWGYDWYKSFEDLLKFQKSDYLSISSRIFSILYGSTRGTAPPSIWGSVWYNFGPFGVFVIPIFLGVVFQMIFYRLVRGRKNLDRLICYSFLIVILGTWIAGSPSRLINNGLATVILLRYLFKKSEKIRFSLRKRVDTYDSKNQYSNASL